MHGRVEPAGEDARGRGAGAPDAGLGASDAVTGHVRAKPMPATADRT
jgi:hypothetical protein